MLDAPTRTCPEPAGNILCKVSSSRYQGFSITAKGGIKTDIKRQSFVGHESYRSRIEDHLTDR